MTSTSFEKIHETCSEIPSAVIIPRAGDIVILVMGLTGSGKSSFINAILGEMHMNVGFEMDSCTTDIVLAETDPTIIQNSQWKDHRLILVDTPSLDDTYIHGATILKKIGQWLGQAYHNKVILGGLLYLHDISIDRFSGTARKSLIVFNRLCGESSLKNVAMVTTKSNRLHPDEVMKRETRFKDVHWKKMIAKGTQVFKADEHDSSQARGIILSLLDRLDTGNMPVLDIQRELVDGRKTIRQTLAWKAAKQLLSAWNMPMRDLRRVPSRITPAF